MPKIKDINDLERDVEDMLKKNKRKKIDDAVKKLAKLDKGIDDLLMNSEVCFKKLNELKGLLAEAKANQGKDDPELANKLKQIEQDVNRIEKDLKDTDDKINDLRKKRNEAKKLLDDIKANPDKFTPQQIDAMLQ